ncbi:glycosyltransferase family 2 protein [Pseudactinotalea terrae]|uniref:glycosyltransferase family 2 protein n=1 Tax=Pseudactinotalea terrae TaxID=1743262 RepID=UPI0012E146C9|nr:glycosyltransferase family 2 protein [Pseudactinotalea terrae]
MRLGRLVGVLILGTSLLGAGLVAWAIAMGSADPLVGDRREGWFFGLWRVLYTTEAPAPRVLVAAVGLGLLMAAGVAFLEHRVSTRARRSLDAERNPLAPRIVLAETRGVFHGAVSVTVLIPAHNEEACIAETIASLKRQSVAPKRIVVVADNCTDRTTAIAAEAGVEVIESIENAHKKAGALNQALAAVLPGQGENDVVMVMDADTTLDQGFVAEAVRRFTDDRALMAVGGLFYGEDGQGLLGQFQRNEYTRYARQIKRRRGRVYVLTGTASMFRPRALRSVASERGRALPGVAGDVYDTVVLTEDNELTLAIKSLGGLMISPPACTVVTEVMPSWRALWAQRIRWQRGAVENLGEYGLRPQVVRYWAQQLGIGYGVIAFAAYVAMLVVMALALDAFIVFPFWVGVGAVFAVERVVTVWKGGWPARLVAALVLPELVYALFLNAAFVKGVMDITLGRRAGWAHVTSGGPGTKVRLAE